MTFSLHNPALLGLLLVVALVVAIVLLVAVAVFLWKARRKEEEEAEGTEQEKLERELLAGTPGMAESFREALRRIKERTPGWGYPYKAPWFVLVGEAGSGKSRIADQISGLSADLIPSGDAEFAPRWLLLDQAVLIDLPGMSFHPASAPETEKQALSTRELAAARCAWQSFLHQTVRCRPREPLNGIVLTLPATELLVAVTDPDHQRRIARIAGIAQRMDEVQQLTGLSLPVYILVTKCDVLPSFNAFAHSLFARVAQGGAEAWSAESGEVQDDLFGWSNPYALEQEYSPAWVEEAFAATRTVLLRHQLEMLSQSQTAADADHIFLFPFELQQLQEPLQVLLNLVFRRTAFRASHRLRGVYFCGETREDDDKPGQLLQLQSSTALLRLPERPANRICFARNLFE